LVAQAASITENTSSPPMMASQKGPAVNRPETKGRPRVRTMRASRSRSANWLKAPALAAASNTARTRAVAFQNGMDGPGVAARPAAALSAIANPIRSLKTP